MRHHIQINTDEFYLAEKLVLTNYSMKLCRQRCLYLEISY